ncbi:hypothetical protein ABZ614_01590 [Streptomyces sp. NPDC013178]|uniref:hypothetical protein n=1 Tax=unclassified Streptomyces TaxID=2593676 RepID=UPI003404F6B2
MQFSTLSLVGSGAFGLVIGWIAYRTLRRAKDGSRVSDLVTVVAALGGGTVINARFPEPDLFACYGLGLAAGFFGYFLVSLLVDHLERRAAAARARERAAAEHQPVNAVPSQAPAPASTWMGDE